MISTGIDGEESHTTVDATPVNKVLFEGNPDSTINARILILCRRPSDGVSKGWDITALMRREGSGNAENLGISAAGSAAYGAAGDLTALSGATIAFFGSGGNIGVTITGIAGQTLNWGIMLRGNQVID